MLAEIHRNAKHSAPCSLDTSLLTVLILQNLPIASKWWGFPSLTSKLGCHQECICNCLICWKSWSWMLWKISEREGGKKNPRDSSKPGSSAGNFQRPTHTTHFWHLYHTPKQKYIYFYFDLCAKPASGLSLWHMSARNSNSGTTLANSKYFVHNPFVQDGDLCMH